MCAIVCYHKPHSRKTLFFQQEEKSKFQIGTSFNLLWNNSFSLRVTIKDFKDSLCLKKLVSCTKLSSTCHKTFLHFLYSSLYLPIQRTVTYKFRFTSFFLNRINSIPYTFLLKTEVLLSFSNHELYIISSFCRLVNTDHPKLYHLQKYLHTVYVS